MSTLPYTFQYRVNITVPDNEIEQPPVFGFSHGYSLGYIKHRLNTHLRPMGYELVRLRQELDESVSIEVRSDSVFDKVIKKACRLQENPVIELVAHVRQLSE